MHPYFDKILESRLVRANIQPLGSNGYDTAQISLEICAAPTVAVFPAIRFHIENVLKRTDILCSLDIYWNKIKKRPAEYLNIKDTVSFETVQEAVRIRLEHEDRHFGTPNNWSSILYSGIGANKELCEFLAERIEDLRNRRIDEETI